MELKSIHEEASDCREACANSKVGDLMQLIHHEQLFELLADPVEHRIDYILKFKPKSEQALRLRMLRPWPGKLPADVDKARADVDKARADYGKAWADVDKARADVDKARADVDKARADVDKAWADVDKAWADYGKALELHRPLLKQQHREAYPDTPWNGKTIFPKEPS